MWLSPSSCCEALFRPSPGLWAFNIDESLYGVDFPLLFLSMQTATLIEQQGAKRIWLFLPLTLIYSSFSCFCDGSFIYSSSRPPNICWYSSRSNSHSSFWILSIVMTSWGLVDLKLWKLMQAFLRGTANDQRTVSFGDVCVHVCHLNSYWKDFGWLEWQESLWMLVEVFYIKYIYM